MKLATPGWTYDNIETIRRVRWRARTDLLFLCNELLGYPGVNEFAHGPMIRALQAFPLPPKSERENFDLVLPHQVVYRPYIPPDALAAANAERATPYLPSEEVYALPDRKTRRRLILQSRGSYKTSVNVIAHTVQWIINYPHLAYLLVHRGLDKAQELVFEIKGKMLADSFRFYFPELIPPTRRDGSIIAPDKWGTQQGFTVRNAGEICDVLRAPLHREGTVSCTSLEAGATGRHVEVIKFTDVIDETNTGTIEQIEKANYRFSLYENVLMRPEAWIDLEGTRYDFRDLYGQIIENWQKSDPAKRRWKIFIRACYERDVPTGLTFTPDDLKYPWALDENRERISTFPQVFTREALEALRTSPLTGGFNFAAQRLLDPVEADDDTRPFPIHYSRVSPSKLIRPITITNEDLKDTQILYFTTTVDTADTTAPGSNCTAITTCGWDKNGRCYVVDIQHGRFLVDQIIDLIIAVNKKYEPKQIKVEEYAFVRGFKSSLFRKCQLLNIYLPIVFLQRETTTSKRERILFALQPPYKNGDLVFLDSLPVLDQVIKEFQQFPKGNDDILDTLADQFQGREWFGRIPVEDQKNAFLTPREQQAADMRRGFEKAFGIEPFEFGQEPAYVQPTFADPLYKKLGRA